MLFKNTIKTGLFGKELNPFMTGCEAYGMTNGCDVNCPTLIDGECGEVEEVFKNMEMDSDERKDLEKIYSQQKIKGG